MNVAVVGVGQTKYAAAKRDQTLVDVIFEATTAALGDAGLSHGDVDAVVIAAHDLVDGRGISSMITATAAGGHFRDEIRVAEDGSYAFVLACLRILSGEFRTVLAASWAKCSEAPIGIVGNLAQDPIYQRPLGINDLSAAALQAGRYRFERGVTERQAALVVSKNRANALRNPHAHLQSEVSIADVMASAQLAPPLRRLDVNPQSDGACAMVLQAGDLVGRRRPAAWVHGVGWATDSYFLGDRKLGELTSTKIAAQRAYAQAGIDAPLVQIDVAEIHDTTSYHELMAYEALGFCRAGAAGRLIEDGVTAPSGALPVNPSGGALSSNPYTATGLVRVAEAALQVMGKSEQRQVSKATTALAQANNGVGSQGAAVVILRSEQRS